MRLASAWHQKGAAFLESRPQLQRKILEGGFWAVLVKGVSMPLNLAVLGLLARLLSPDEMGNYYLAFSLITAASTLGMLGMGQTMVRIVAAAVAMEDHRTVRQTILRSFGFGLIGGITAAITLYLLGPRLGLPLSVMLMVALWAIAQTGQNLLAEAMRAFSDIRAATIFQNRTLSNLTLTVIFLILLTTGMAIEFRSLMGMIVLASIVAVAIGLLFLYLKLRTLLPVNGARPAQIDQSHIFVQALPVFGVNAMGIIRAQIGVWIVAAFLSNEELALYGSATRLVYLVSVPLMTVVNALIPPIIAELFAKNQIARLERTIRSLASAATLVSGILTIIFVAGGNVILQLIFGDFYVDAWLILAILAVSQLMDVASGSCGVTLTMTGHQATLMKVTVVSAVLAVVSTIVGAMLWGMLGVALATAFTLIAQNILTILTVKWKVGIWTHVRFSR